MSRALWPLLVIAATMPSDLDGPPPPSPTPDRPLPPYDPPNPGRLFVGVDHGKPAPKTDLDHRKLAAAEAKRARRGARLAKLVEAGGFGVAR